MSGDFRAQLAEFRQGSLLGAYRLEEQIDYGGMAVVFRARDERLGRLVALKILAPALTADEAFRRRFKAESRAAAMVDDPHIIPIYEADEAGGVLFIAMRFVPGGDLRKVLKREGPLPPSRVAEVISPVASALDAAHAAGLIHRDVKPANILVDAHPDRPDHVYLSDFGLSKRTTGSVGITPKGGFLGTLGYCAPEQIRGLAVDGRADQYSLACVAYQLLTSSQLFDRDEDASVMYAHLAEEPPSLSWLRPDLTRSVDQVLARALAKAPQERYGSCRDFADALRQAFGLAPYRSGPIPIRHRRRAVIASPPSGFPRSAAVSNGKRAVPAGSAEATIVRSTPRASSMAGRRVRRVGRAHRRRNGFIGATSILVVAAIAVAFTLINDPGKGSTKIPPRPALHISPHLVRTLDGRVAGIDVAYSPDGLTLVTANSYGGINLWNPATGQKILAPRLEPYYDGTDQWGIYVAYSPDGKTWAVAGANNVVSVWDATTSQIIVSIHVPNCSDGPGDIAYGPDGVTLAAVCGSAPAKIYLWNVVTGHVISAFNSPPDPNVNVMAYSPKGTTLVTADNNDTSANVPEKTYLWNVATKRIIATLTDPSSHGTNYVTYSPDGKTIATGDGNGDIYLWDSATGREIATFPTHCQGTSNVAFSPNGTTLASVCGLGGNSVNLWDFATRHILATLTEPDTQGVAALEYSPNGTSLAVGDNNGNIYVWTHVSG